jgi:hypothetical protein
MTQSERLHRLLHERMEDQFELWDLLEQVKIGGFEPRRLLSALPGEPHHICGIVPPMLPRLGHGSTLTIRLPRVVETPKEKVVSDRTHK